MNKFLTLFLVLSSSILVSSAKAATKVAKNTDFMVRLTQTLDTNSSKKDDQVVAQVISCGADTSSPCEFKDDFLYGKVTESKSSGKVTGNSVLTFRFTEIDHKGEKIPVQTSLKQVTNSKGAPDVDEEGRAIKKKNNTGKLVAAAAGGALVGGLLGGAKGAAIGAGVGGGAALLAMEVSASGANFRLDGGSQLLLSVSPGGKPVEEQPAGTQVAQQQFAAEGDAPLDPALLTKYPDAHGFVVVHDHGNDTNIANWHFCRGVLYIFSDHVKYEVQDSRDGRRDDFDHVYGEIGEAKKNFMPIAKQNAFHIKLKSGENFNFVPVAGDLPTLLGAFPAPPRK
jgi:hypothetical protein